MMVFVGMSTHTSDIQKWNILIALAFAAIHQTVWFICVDYLVLLERMCTKASILLDNSLTLLLTIVNPEYFKL